MTKRIWENKILIGVVIAIIGLVMSWGIWVTDGVYKSDKTQTVAGKTVESICDDINDVKKAQATIGMEIKEIRGELKEQRDLIHTNQEKILDRLGGISKSLKRQNDR